jgi:hypothetical protein
MPAPATALEREVRRPAGGERQRAPGRGRAPWEQQRLAPEVRLNPDRSRCEERHRSGGEVPPAEAGGRRLTLDQLVAGAWEGLLSAGSAPCPVCTARMELHAGVGRCSGCGSRLT